VLLRGGGNGPPSTEQHPEGFLSVKEKEELKNNLKKLASRRRTFFEDSFQLQK